MPMHTHTSSYGSHLLLLSWIPSAVVDDQLHSSFVMKIFFLLQVITLSVTGALNNVLSQAHKDEMRRYLYNHQVTSIVIGGAIHFLKWCWFHQDSYLHFLLTIFFTAFVMSYNSPLLW
jgi:hypothetical protein